MKCVRIRLYILPYIAPSLFAHAAGLVRRKHIVNSNEQLDFLKEIFEDIPELPAEPEPQPASRGNASFLKPFSRLTLMHVLLNPISLHGTQE